MFDDHPVLIAAKLAGRFACADGLPLDLNPHPWQADEYTEWRNGWLAEWHACEAMSLEVLIDMIG